MYLNRREFLKLTSKSALLSGACLTMPLSLKASTIPVFNDYKALVCVMLHGGNDSINMFIPSGNDSEKGYAKYASIRESLAINNNDLTTDLNTLNPYHDSDSTSKAYLKGFYKHANIDGLATNALMPEIAKLINNNKIAIVANMGTLVEPTTKEQIKNKSVNLPQYLYAHNHQRRIMENGEASNLKTLGWAGRLFDEWKGVNGNDLYGMNISYAGKTYLFNAEKTSPLILSRNGPISHKNITGAKADLYNSLNSINHTNPFKRLYSSMLGISFTLINSLKSDWNNAYTFTHTNDYGLKLFEVPTKTDLGIDTTISTNFSQQLEAVAKMIKIGKDRGLKRQIFYVQLGGFDTHSGQLQQHAKLLRTLSLGMGDFQAAMAELNMEDEVTTFNLSDFGRSIGNNGDGTDHAWGGHYFAMGGAVNAGLYGTLPDLNLDGPDDASKKGRLIPTISSDEYLSTILKWYGVDDEFKKTLLPNLKKFSNPDLGFLNT